MNFGNYNNYFGSKNSLFGKYYIDYCINEISKTNKFTEEESKIISKAKVKYYFINCINFFIFLYTTRVIYKKGWLQIYAGDNILNLRDFFLIRLTFSMGAMIYIYKESQRFYYNDVKYIIKKYKHLTPQQYKEAMINSKIAEVYKDQIELIEKNN